MTSYVWVGVYRRTPTARYTGGHAVKAIGWGVENGVPYWWVNLQSSITSAKLVQVASKFLGYTMGRKR